MSKHREFMQLAVDQARESKSEDSSPRPKVGAVAVRDDTVLAVAHRGELKAGEHAEYTLLEGKLKDHQLAGATVYTTLEPCTDRHAPKIACVSRLIERKVARVYVGMLDPNPDIRGLGVRKLQDAGIEAQLFDHDLMQALEELNRDFTRSFGVDQGTPFAMQRVVDTKRSRPLESWYEAVNYIYHNRNFHLPPEAILAHLVEVIGGLSLLASKKRKLGPNPRTFVPKALAWWFALCGKMGVRSIGDLLWAKFPAVCPYCERSPHDLNTCQQLKDQKAGPDWERLALRGQVNAASRPESLGSWQKMFASIYPVQNELGMPHSFARLMEEVGELAEAVRVFPAARGYFISEAADVFAWLMNVQNHIDRENDRSFEQIGQDLETGFATAYPNSCTSCGTHRCVCAPILQSTIGRIANEIPNTSVHVIRDFYMDREEVLFGFRPGTQLP